MDKKEILEFLNANPVCFLATAEGSQPHVRGMLMYRADENGIIFSSGTMKDLYKQIKENPQVELCFFSQKDNTQIRVSGSAKLVDDLEFKKEIVNNRDFLKPWVEERGYEMLSVFRIENCQATVWTIEANFAPKSWIKLGK